MPPGGPTGVGQTLVGAAGRLSAGNIASRAISFFTGIVAARILTDIEFGGFGAVQTAVTTAGTLATLALGLAATRYVARFRNESSARAADIARLILLVSTVSTFVIGICFLGGIPWLAQRVMVQPSIEEPLRAGVLYMAGVVGFGVASGVLLGYERYAATAVAAIVQNGVILGGVVLLGPEMRLTGVILAQALGFGASWLLALWFLRKELRGFSKERFRSTVRADLRELARFSVPHSLSALILTPAGSIAVVLLARSQPNGYAELGYFTAGQRYYLLILFVGGFIGSALLPVLSRLSSDPVDSARGLDYGLIGTGLLVVPVGVAVIFSAPALMTIFGPTYRSHWVVLIPIAAWATIEAVGGVLSIALMARGQQWFVFAQQASFALALVVLSVPLRTMGAPGLAAANLGGLLFVAAWSFLPMKDRLRPSRRAVTAYLLSLIMTGAAAIISITLPPGWFVIVAPIGAGVAFFAYLSLLGSAEKEALLKALRHGLPALR